MKIQRFNEHNGDGKFEPPKPYRDILKNEFFYVTKVLAFYGSYEFGKGLFASNIHGSEWLECNDEEAFNYYLNNDIAIYYVIDITEDRIISDYREYYFTYKVLVSIDGSKEYFDYRNKSIESPNICIDHLFIPNI